MSLVFQNIDPRPPLRPASVYPRLCWWGRTHSLGGEGVGGGGAIFWKTRDIGLPSSSNNLSTVALLAASLIQYLLERLRRLNGSFF